MSDLYKAFILRCINPPYINGLPNGTFSNIHPMESIKKSTGYFKNKRNSDEMSLSLKYDNLFFKGLNFKVLYNIYNRQDFSKEFLRPYDMYVFKTTGEHNHITTNEVLSSFKRDVGDYLKETYNRDHSYQLNLEASYNNKIGNHNFGALFVYEQYEGNTDWFNSKINYFISSEIDQIFAGSQDSKDSSVGGSASETGRLSYIGRLNYDYANKYLLETSFRYDGSVNFSPNKRWGFFPSVSTAWRVSEENFFKNKVKFIDYLKIRASVGLLGNDAVGGWQWLQGYKFDAGAQFGELSKGIRSGVLANPNITWEKTLSYNCGLDMQFLHNKFSVSLDGFYKHTYDILGSRIASLPTTFGASMPNENYAKINAKGLEIELSYNNKINRKIDYYVKGNFSYADNKLILKDEAENLRSYQSEIGLNTGRVMGLVATDLIRTQDDLDKLPKGYTILGKKPELGMLNYKDLRGPNSDEPDGKITDDDKDWIIKHTIPPINYGFSFGGNIGNFSCDILLQGSTGNKKLIDYKLNVLTMQQSDFAFWNDSYSEENINAKFPKITDGKQANVISSFWVRDASFLRLKNVMLSYNFKSSFLSKIGLSKLKCFITGTNLFLLEDHVKYVDPESDKILSYPIMKNYSFGVNLTF